MKFFTISSEVRSAISDLYNDIEAIRDDILSYPLDANQDVVNERSHIATQLKYALNELSNAYQTLCDLKVHFANLHKLEHNVVVKR